MGGKQNKKLIFKACHLSFVVFLMLGIKTKRQHGFKKEHSSISPVPSPSGDTMSITFFLPVSVYTKIWSGFQQSKTLAQIKVTEL